MLEMQRRDTQLIPPKRVTCMPQNFTHVKRHYPHHWPWRAARQDHLNLLGLNRLCKQFRIECLGITKSRHFSLCRNGVATSVKGCVSFAMTYVPPKHLVCRYCGLCSFLKSAEICLKKEEGKQSAAGCVHWLRCFCLRTRGKVEMAVEVARQMAMNYPILFSI